jgi:hypothetical protein
MCHAITDDSRRSLCIALLLCAAAAAGVAAASPDEAPVTNPLGGGEAVTLEPVAPPAPPTRRRSVYVCRGGAVPEYSDRPCGLVSESQVVAYSAPGRVATTAPPAPAASTRPRREPVRADGEPVPSDPKRERCASIDRQIEAVDGRMRAGYSAREAARLWTRWRDLKEERRRTGC